MQLCELIAQLEALEAKHGGETPVAVGEKTLREVEEITEVFSKSTVIRLWPNRED